MNLPIKPDKSKSSSLNHMQKFRFSWRGYIAGGLVLLVGLGMLYTLLVGSSMNEEEMRFSQYLNDKYGKEFTIDDIESTGGGFGVEYYRQGKAYAKNDQL